MAHSIQRLTIFALLSALEIDIRELLNLYLMPTVGEATLFNAALRGKCTDRFRHSNPDTTPDADDLIDYLDLGDAIQLLRANDAAVDPSMRTYLKRYYPSLDAMIPIRNRAMHSRPLEFDDLMRVTDLARSLTGSYRLLWANLRTTIRSLDHDPEYATTLAIPELTDEAVKLLHNLPQVEFDDTGFMGREKEITSLKKALAGTYPIVTIVGEGGQGKTALALKVCYDLLDDNQIGLDAIIWTSAKTTKLTVNELQQIKGSLTSSIGIIDSALAPLGRQTGTQAIDDLVKHLANNKILLIIDNLETVVDHNLRYLASNMPNSGSKILFTSRLSLGAFDFPIPLLPLSKKDAALYFRAIGRVFSVNDLATLSNVVIDEYCNKLHYNTLGIKWFMHSVSVGKRPTVILSDQKQFLQFCLQNVFYSLSPDVILIAKLLANVGGLQTAASLAFYSDLDSLAIQSALSVLITSNLVAPERGRNVEDEELYGLSSLSRAYIHGYLRMDADEQKRLFRKQNELRSTKEEMNARLGKDAFDINYVFVRDDNDIIVANFLTKAINKIFVGGLAAADIFLSRAEDLNPNYFEVHRVRAFYYLKSGDYLAAGFAYNAAISLAPDRAPLRMWYGGFLSRNIGDQRAALDQLLEAERLAPTAVLVKLECARVMQYLLEFKQAEAKLSGIPNIDALPARTRRVHLDLMIQNNTRRAEFEVHEGEFKQALHYLERARDIFIAAPLGLIDFRTVKGLNHARFCFPALKRAFLGLPEADRLSDLEIWMPFPGEANPTSLKVAVSNEAVVEQTSRDVVTAGHPPTRGRLVEVHENYGFVDAGGSHYFFHRGQWKGTTDFTQLEKGSIVRFTLETPEDGRIQAMGVKPVYDSAEDLAVGTVLSGSVKTVQHNHGFITLDVGVDLFFHRSQCGPGTRFNKLVAGDRVQCTVGTSTSGRPQACAVELFSGAPLG